MLTCKIDKEKGGVHIKTKGTAETITVELLALIQEIHSGIRKENEPAAEAFRLAVLGSLLDPSSPVWKEI